MNQEESGQFDRMKEAADFTGKVLVTCKEEDSDGRAKVTTEEAGLWRLFQHKLSIQHHTENDSNLFIFMLNCSSGVV